MPSQQPDEASIVVESLSRYSFILVVFANQFVFSLPSHEIIVAKEDVDFMMNFDNKRLLAYHYTLGII